METPTIEVERLANMHSHLRELPQANDLIRYALDGGAYAILPMPNTQVELTTADLVQGYCDGLRKLVPEGTELTFIPTAFLTETTTEEDVMKCFEKGICDFKIYPRNRTTKSEKGTRRYFKLIELIRNTANRIYPDMGGMKVHLHPEHPNMTYGNRTAEFAFTPIVDMLLDETKAKIIWEHGTDSDCIPLWKEFATSGRFYVTLTAHHLATNEDRTFGDVRATCKPPIKREIDRELLVRLVCEGTHWVMAGGDDAPHPISKKHVHEGQCACGAYTAPFLLQLYAHALDDLLKHGTKGPREIFDDFVSLNAAALYGFRPSSRMARLVRKSFKIPGHYQAGDQVYEPFWAGQEILYSLEA